MSHLAGPRPQIGSQFCSDEVIKFGYRLLIARAKRCVSQIVKILIIEKIKKSYKIIL